MKFEVRHGTRSAANRLPCHSYNEAQQRLRPRVTPENLRPLRFDGRATDFDDPNIISAMFHSDTPQQCGIQHGGNFACGQARRSLRKTSDGRVILELHKTSPQLVSPKASPPDGRALDAIATAIVAMRNKPCIKLRAGN